MTLEVRAGKLYIHATNVHQGGGKSLLLSIIQALPRPGSAVLVVDSRMSLPDGMPENTQIKRVSASVLHRAKAEKWLARNVQPQDIVLCFGNLPPLFKLRGHVAVFIQNRYLVDKVSLKNFSMKIRCRLAVERLWFSGRAVNADEFVVQTPSMKAALLSSGCVVNQSVHVRPFANVPDDCRKVSRENNEPGHKRYDFIYVASGEAHKNHRRLVEAWCLLAEQGQFPSLCLTLDEDKSAALYDWINERKFQYGLKLENVGSLPHGQVIQLYAQARALIYPSQFESLGLPLIEARQAGLPVLAAELDYVRDVIVPEQSFNPESPVSIACAVKRYFGIVDMPIKILDAAHFLDKLIDRRI
jgi:glycosyltransferase involved in cell wall biosynthesis